MAPIIALSSVNVQYCIFHLTGSIFGNILDGCLAA